MNTERLAQLSQSEDCELRNSLLALLRRQACAFTLGDSASLPGEMLENLLSSLLYTLGINFSKPQTYAHLTGKSLPALYEAGLRSLHIKTAAARRLVFELFADTPNLGCIALSDTVRSIHHALQNYDACFFAHRIPGEIDYQLCQPVADSFQGIDYTLLYLTQLQSELRFIGCFPLHRALAVLDGTNPEWRELVNNLYAPIAANALGLILLGENPRRLHISHAGREKLLSLLSGLHPLDIENRLMRQSASLLLSLDLHQASDTKTLQAFCCELAPRLACAVQSRDLRHVFCPFALPKSARVLPAPGFITHTAFHGTSARRR